MWYYHRHKICHDILSLYSKTSFHLIKSGIFQNYTNRTYGEKHLIFQVFQGGNFSYCSLLSFHNDVSKALVASKNYIITQS